MNMFINSLKSEIKNRSMLSVCSACGIKVPSPMITHCDKCAKEALDKQNEEYLENKIKQYLFKANIPSSLSEVSIENIEPHEDQTEFAKYINDIIIDNINWRGPYIYGNAGTGKTLLGTCLFKKIIKTHIAEGMFINMAEFLLKYRGESLNSTRLCEIMSAPILILDDIGNHNISKFVIEILYSIINVRIGHKRTTIITSNFSPLDLSEMFTKYGIEEKTSKSIRDRLFELCDPVQLDKTNIRYKNNMLRIKK